VREIQRIKMHGKTVKNDQFVEKHSSTIVRSERYSLLAWNLTVDHKRRKPIITNEPVYSI